jgi:hypothetical protein
MLFVLNLKGENLNIVFFKNLLNKIEWTWNKNYYYYSYKLTQLMIIVISTSECKFTFKYKKNIYYLPVALELAEK